MKKIVFLSGTRADYGKLKSIILELEKDEMTFNTSIFVTGMHMIREYGYTVQELERAQHKNIYKFINQSRNDSMDLVLSKTIQGFSDFIKENGADLIVVHGDRVEALAGAIVGALNNIHVSHIEGGEVSGTIDELIRHAVSKLSHSHFVANITAANRLLQLGEQKSSIYEIGSPDIDVMLSDSLPDIQEVKKRYNISFEEYGIVLFHPVTTETDLLKDQIKIFVDALLDSQKEFVVIYPNNDQGSRIIIEEYQRFNETPRIKVYPSIRFEYFLTLLKNSCLLIGNSSAGIREAPIYGIKSINLGSRQTNRSYDDDLLNLEYYNREAICSAILTNWSQSRSRLLDFGSGDSAMKFKDIITEPSFSKISIQKVFQDAK